MAPRILMLTQVFPPEQGAGVFRPAAFAGGLARRGWDVAVLAPRLRRLYSLDPESGHALPAGVRVIRTGGLEPAPLIHALASISPRLARAADSAWFWPDARVGWLPFALGAACALHVREPFDLVWSTSPPFTTAVAGRRLHHRLRIPWVADLRNEWTTNQYDRGSRPAWHRALSRRFEALLLRDAAAVTTLSPAHSGLLRTQAPHAAEKIRTLENGFDAPEGAAPPRPRSALWRIHYAGSFLEAEEIRALWTALDALGRAGSIDPSRVEWRLFGPAPDELRRAAPSGWRLRFEGVRPRREVDAAARDSDLLILPVRVGATRQLPGKLYESLPREAPILVVGEAGGLAAQRVLRARRGGAADSRNPEALRQALAAAWAAWSEGKPPFEPDREYVGRFRRDRQVGWLAELLEAVVAGRPVPPELEV